MSAEQTSLYVDRFYEMDPEFDDILFSGAEVREGMVVLLEDCLLRADLSRDDIYNADRARECNRWCTVERVEVKPRPDCSSALLRFLARYGDGTKRLRSYDISYAWIVKKDSIGADGA